MRTCVQPTGGIEVSATVHRTGLVLRFFQVTALFGFVTANGPIPVTVTRVASRLTPPPPARLSRTVQRNNNARAVGGSDSPNVARFERMSDMLGKVREGLVVGANE